MKIILFTLTYKKITCKDKNYGTKKGSIFPSLTYNEKMLARTKLSVTYQIKLFPCSFRKTDLS